jgi:hypothetical protein
MATTLKALARGTFPTSSASLYTVPASTTTVLSNISICNTTSGTVYFYILLNGVELFSNTPIEAYSTTVVDIKQALATTQIIAGYANASGIKYHFSGAEIS